MFVFVAYQFLVQFVKIYLGIRMELAGLCFFYAEVRQVHFQVKVRRNNAEIMIYKLRLHGLRPQFDNPADGLSSAPEFLSEFREYGEQRFPEARFLQ